MFKPSAVAVVWYLNVILRMQTLCNKTIRHVEESDYFSAPKIEDDFQSIEALAENKNITFEGKYFLSPNASENENAVLDIDEQNSTTTLINASKSEIEKFTQSPETDDVTLAATNVTSNNYTCIGCHKEKYSDEDLKQLRIETVKQVILDKLQLSQVPTVKIKRSDIPVPVLDAGIRQDEEDHWARKSHEDPYYVKKKKIFITAKDETSHCSMTRATGCYYFRVDRKVAPSDVSSAVFMIYKQWDPNDDYTHTFIISELESTGHSKLRARNIVARIEGHKAQGWVEVDISTTVIRWLNKPNRNDGISITCKSCRRRKHSLIFGAKGGLRPILVITTKKREHSRRLRRTSHCSSSGKCCKARLIIDLQEIGWNWIIQPRRIQVDYCRGSCNDITQAQHNHTIAIQNYRWDESEDVFRELEPCCSPTSWFSQSILYQDDKGSHVSGTIPNLVVKTCGCT